MSFASESRERVRPVLPLAGMVDILFLLLIFFMTAGAMRERETTVAIEPPTSSQGVDRTTPGVVVAATADNQLVLNGVEVTLGELAQRLRAHGQSSPGEAVTLRADETSHVGLFAQVQDLVIDAGLTFQYATVRPASALD
ncbi:MAG: biopolymer transporter ExbD [Planctomycetota bacterium]